MTQTFATVLLLLAAGSMVGELPHADSSNRAADELSELQSSAVQTLTDATYDEVMGRTKGLAMVWLCSSNAPLDGAQFVAGRAGGYAERFQLFHMNRDENPVVWERILSGQIRPEISGGKLLRGGRRIVQQPVLVLMLFNGKEFAECESAGHITPEQIEEKMVWWISQESTRLERHLRGKSENTNTVLTAETVVPFFRESLIQMQAPRTLNYNYDFYFRSLWSCMLRLEPAEGMAPLVPMLVGQLEGEDGIAVCRILARIGEGAAPAVEPLISIIEDSIRLADLKAGEEETVRRRAVGSMELATAAAFALGGIGPKAESARSLLAGIAESEFEAMPGAVDRSGRKPEQRWPRYADGALGLQCALSLSRITPPPAPGKNSGEYSGSTLRVWSQGPDPTAVKAVRVVFWNGRYCYETESDDKGKYSIRLPVGRYLMQHGRYLPSQDRDFRMSNSNMDVVEVTPEARVRKDVAAELIFVDYGHNAVFELGLKDAPTNTPVSWVSDADLERLRAMIALVISPRESAEFMRVCRAKGGRAVLEIRAFGPKWAAEAAKELEGDVREKLSDHHTLILTPLGEDRDDLNALQSHTLSCLVTLNAGSEAEPSELRDRLAQALKPFLETYGFVREKRGGYRWIMRYAPSANDQHRPLMVTLGFSGLRNNGTLVEISGHDFEAAAWAERMEPDFFRAVEAGGDFKIQRRKPRL